MKRFIVLLIVLVLTGTVAYAETTPTDLPLGTQTDGTVITEAEDGTIVIDTSALDGSEFLSKPFNSYTAVEGFLLLFLLLFFCLGCWLVIRRCFYG